MNNNGRVEEYKGIWFRTVGKGIRHCQTEGCRRITHNYMSHANWHVTGVGDEGY